MKGHVVTAALLMSVSAAGCQGPTPPERTMPVSNRHYSVDRLFTDENGCTVYRFYDFGEYHYYIVGPRPAQMMEPTPKTMPGDTGAATLQPS